MALSLNKIVATPLFGDLFRGLEVAEPGDLRPT
jgi:hypothetical protein